MDISTDECKIISDESHDDVFTRSSSPLPSIPTSPTKGVVGLQPQSPSEHNTHPDNDPEENNACQPEPQPGLSVHHNQPNVPVLQYSDPQDSTQADTILRR